MWRHFHTYRTSYDAILGTLFSEDRVTATNGCLMPFGPSIDVYFLVAEYYLVSQVLWRAKTPLSIFLSRKVQNVLLVLSDRRFFPRDYSLVGPWLRSSPNVALGCRDLGPLKLLLSLLLLLGTVRFSVLLRFYAWQLKHFDLLTFLLFFWHSRRWRPSPHQRHIWSIVLDQPGPRLLRFWLILRQRP
jgi:hypothetical protein